MFRPVLLGSTLCVLLTAPACSRSKEAVSEPPPSAEVLPLPTITVPTAVPAEAAGIVVLRSTESLLATVANIELLGPMDPADREAMHRELDDFMQSRVGVTISSADRATAFYLPPDGLAVVLQGVEGTPRGKHVGTVGTVPLWEVDGATTAVVDGQLVIGGGKAVERAVAAALGEAPSLVDRGGPLLEALVRRSEGVTMAAAVDVFSLPASLRREAEATGIEQAMISYGGGGIRVVAYGRPEAMARLRDLIVQGLERARQESERAYEQALAGGEVWSSFGVILSHHQLEHVQQRVVPTLDGRRLSLHLPVQFGDPMVLTAFAGMAAAIAIPALTKYMRRSKTSEARIGLAKMFDGASAFFNEESLRRGDIRLMDAQPEDLVHRCPSDGRRIGSAGVTPPLSVDCNAGPGGRCVPVAREPRNPGEYSIDLWLDNPVWNELNFVMEQPHAFHYDFRWENDLEGFGSCMFTAQSFGDLDADGLFSTYERSGAGDRNGINAAAGLYIDREVE